MEKITNSKFQNFKSMENDQLQKIIGGRREATGAGGKCNGHCDGGESYSRWSGDSIDDNGGTTYYNYSSECVAC